MQEEKNIKFADGSTWNWKKRFHSLSAATEFLLDHTSRIGPMLEEVYRRLKSKEAQLHHVKQQLKKQKDINNGKLKRRHNN